MGKEDMGIFHSVELLKRIPMTLPFKGTMLGDFPKRFFPSTCSMLHYTKKLRIFNILTLCVVYVLTLLAVHFLFFIFRMCVVLFYSILVF